MRLNEPYIANEIQTVEKIVKKTIFYTFASLMQALRPIITEELQVYDKEKSLENKVLTSGPCMWAFKHETTFDPVNITPLWKKIPGLPDLKIIAKHFQGKEKIIAPLIDPFVLHVFRTTRRGWKNEEERRQMEEENRKLFETLKSNYLRGTHCLIFPEGTTETDGTVLPIKSGCYNLSFIKQDNLYLKIPIIPAGINYDRFSGNKHWLTGRRRYLAFVNIGTPFTYERMHEDVKQDIKYHTNQVRNAIINCNTITAAQLAGEYIVKRAMKKEPALTPEQLQRTVAARVSELRRLEGLVFDNALLDCRKREKRVANLYEGIQGYFDNGELNLERVLLETNYVEYKKKNPLRYSANGLMQLAETRSDVNEILEKTR